MALRCRDAGIPGNLADSTPGSFGSIQTVRQGQLPNYVKINYKPQFDSMEVRPAPGAGIAIAAGRLAMLRQRLCHSRGYAR